MGTWPADTTKYMFLAGLFIAAFVQALSSPAPITVPGNPNSSASPICVIVAAASIVPQSQCDPTRTRTLFDILYSCIGVIMLCTYISIHHNLPKRKASWMKVKWLRIRTTLYALLAPEFIIMWAINERIIAGRIAKKMKDQKWTRTHGFFVQMGGLVQLTSNSTEHVLDYRDISDVKIPRIPEKEIRDHGKGDVLAKAIVVIQTTWFVAQCIARHTQGLVLTEIELVTLAFAALNVITYGLWWDKPLNVEYPIYFDEEGKRVDGPEEESVAWYRGMWEGNKEYCVGWRKSIHWHGVVVTVFVKGIVEPFSAVFGPLMDMMDMRDHRNVFWGLAIGVIFGGVHLVGWNFQFPTTTELWLWRASSIVITAAPLLLAISVALELIRGATVAVKILWASLSFFTLYVCPLIYLAARLINLFLAFYTLRALPDSAYQNVRWTEFIPHI